MEQGDIDLVQILSIDTQTEEPVDPSVLSKDIARYLMDSENSLIDKWEFYTSDGILNTSYKIERIQGNVFFEVRYYDINNSGVYDPNPNSTLNLWLTTPDPKMGIMGILAYEFGLTGRVREFIMTTTNVKVPENIFKMSDQQKYELFLRQVHTYLIGK